MSRRSIRYSRIFIVLLLWGMVPLSVHADWFNSVQSGSWTDPATWGRTSGYPVNGDGVSIQSGHAISYSGDLSWTSNQIGIYGSLSVAGSLTIGSGANLYVYTGSQLHVDGNFYCQNSLLTVGNSSTLTVSGEMTTSGQFNLEPNAGATVGRFLVVGGQFNSAGSLTVGQYLSVTGEINNNSGASLNVSGNVTASKLNNSATLQVGQSLSLTYEINNNSGSFLRVVGNVTSSALNNSGTIDIDGNLTLTSGDLNVNSGIVAVDGNLTKSGNIAGTATLIVGGDFYSNGGSTWLPGNGGRFYVFGALSESSSQANCTSRTSTECFPNDACATCLIRSGNQWISDGSPGSSYISYSPRPSWWEDHLANVGESDGPSTVCPGAASTFTLAAVTTGVGSLSGNRFEWAVYGGAITAFNGTSVESHSGTYSGHTASYQSVTGMDGTSNYTLTVAWEPAAFDGAYVAVRQTSEAGCSDGKWSVFYIHIQDIAAPTASSPQSFCGSATVADLVATPGNGGNSVVWYTQASGGIALNSTDALQSGAYYAETRSADGCASPLRTAVTVSVAVLPTAAATPASSSVCPGNDAIFNLSGTANATVTYRVNSGSDQTVALNGSGSATVTIAGVTSTQTLTLVSAALSGCSQNLSATATVTVGGSSFTITCPPGTTADCVKNLPVVTTIAEFKAQGGQITPGSCTSETDLSISTQDVIDPNAGNCQVVRTFTVNDGNGNTSTCTQTFTITDTQAPVMTCPADLVVAPDNDACGATLTITQPSSISENCSLVSEGAHYAYRLGDDPAGNLVEGDGNIANAPFPLGTTTITWTIADECGHVSNACTQTIRVAFNLTPIGYDDGSGATGVGSGVQPLQTSTHSYFVDNKTPEPGYSYTWGLYENNGGTPATPVNSSLYAINYTNAATINLTYSNLGTGNYILKVIKTKNSTTCQKEETIQVNVSSNELFDVALHSPGDQCQAPGTGATTTIRWQVTFPAISTSPFMFSYNITMDGTTVSSGNVNGITYSPAIPLTPASPGLPPYSQYAKGANSYTVEVQYTFYSATGSAGTKALGISIQATDAYQVSEPVANQSNNTDALDAFGVPVITFE